MGGGGGALGLVSGLRMLRIYGADAERQDFPVPRRVEHAGVQTFKAWNPPKGWWSGLRRKGAGGKLGEVGAAGATMSSETEV